MGTDDNGDGIGELPYVIRGGNNYDMYPLMNPWNKGSEPPLPPTIKGQISGKIRTEYEYTFNTIDPNNNDVYYWIDWGDGRTDKWVGPFNSGKDIMLKHRWVNKGTFTIKAIAMNTNYSTSPWSTFEVTIPRIKPFVFKFNLLNWLFERFQKIFPILKLQDIVSIDSFIK